MVFHCSIFNNSCIFCVFGSQAERKEAEKKRIADKRAKKRVDSYDNDSNVLRLDDLGLTSYYKENGRCIIYLIS